MANKRLFSPFPWRIALSDVGILPNCQLKQSKCSVCIAKVHCQNIDNKTTKTCKNAQKTALWGAGLDRP